MPHTSRKEKQTLYAYLLNEGVLTHKKECIGKHADTKIDNLKVGCCMKSLQSRGFAKEIYSWGHRYYTITTEGCAFLRGELGINNVNVHPKTHQQRPQEQPQGREGGDRRQMTRGRGGFRGRGGDGGFRGRGGDGGFRGEGAPEGGDNRKFAKPQNEVAAE